MNPQHSTAGCQIVPLISLGLYYHLASSMCVSFCQMCFLCCLPKSEIRLCVWLTHVLVRVAVSVSDYFLRRIAIYMTSHFPCRFEVSPERLFASPTVTPVCVFVCVCVPACLHVLFTYIFIFAAWRVLCLRGLQTVGAQAS